MELENIVANTVYLKAREGKIVSMCVSYLLLNTYMRKGRHVPDEIFIVHLIGIPLPYKLCDPDKLILRLLTGI